MTQTIQIPTRAWYGDVDATLTFPEHWDVQECRMAGHDTPALSEEQILEALDNPYGSGTLRELSRGKKQAVILFDDLTRPAPTARILPFVLEALAEAGLDDDHIRFVGAFANHAAMSREDFVKKLGADVLRRFRVYNHNPYEHHVDLGKTSRGTPILVNREVMDCDLKIGIGGLIPHIGAGFGGGGKLVFPGVMSIESVAYNHGKIRSKSPSEETGMLGIVEGNILREDIEEAVGKIGLDMKIDLLINNRREIIGVFAGDFIAQHRAGVERARMSFEVEGNLAYSSFLCPQVGPAQTGDRGARPWATGRPDIVIFLADTFRADNMETYGGKLDLTPNLDRFAKSSRRFLRAWSPSTNTLPAHASLFTGLYPLQTGVVGHATRLRIWTPPARDVRTWVVEGETRSDLETAVRDAREIWLQITTARES